MSDWILLDKVDNVEVNPDGQVDNGVSLRYIPADPAHRTEIDGTVFPFIETNYCVSVPWYRQARESDGTVDDDYRYAVEEQTVIARTPDDMDYEYEWPDAFDYETLERAIVARDGFVAQESPEHYIWRPWATGELTSEPEAVQ